MFPFFGGGGGSNDPGRVKHVDNDSHFSKELSDAGDRLVVVDFFATWCGPCQMTKAPFAQLSERYPNAVFLKVDTDQLRETSARAGVRAMPTFQLYKKREKIAEVVGANMTELESQIKRHYDSKAAAPGAAASFAGKGHVLGGGGETSGHSGMAYVNPYRDRESIQSTPAPKPATTATTAHVQNTASTTAPMNYDEEDQELARAIALSQGDSNVAQQPLHGSDETTTGANTDIQEDLIEPPLNAELIQSLIDMEFSRNRAVRALYNTGNLSIEAAINWLVEHQEDPDIDAPLLIPQPKQTTPLTPEEARERALALQRKIRDKMHVHEAQNELQHEKTRRLMGKETQSAQRQWEDEQRKRDAEEKKRQKNADKEARDRIRRLLEQDKAERRGQKTGEQPPPPPPPQAPQAVSQPPAQPIQSREYTECVLQIRQTNGVTLQATFKPSDTLATVQSWISRNRTDGTAPFVMITNFPRNTFTGAKLQQTVQEAGLVPRGAIILTK